jgi:hypothetical protein
LDESFRRAYGTQLGTIARMADISRLLPPPAALELVRTVELANSHLARDVKRISSLYEQMRSASASYADAARASSLALHMGSLFRLPSAVELHDIQGVLGTVHASNALRTFELSTSATAHVLKQIEVPWLRNQHEFASIQSVVDLAAIGNALATLPPFDQTLGAAMRRTLGDWRHVSIPKNIIDDVVKRTKLYERFGFDSRLTSFSPEAFNAALRATAIHLPKLLRRDEKYQPPVPLDPLIDTGEDAPDYMKSAYAIMFSFESHLRRFIDREMTRAFGSAWVKHQIPGEMRRGWEERRDQETAHSNATHPLICYADFTDYVNIICRRDNWKKVFEPFFQRADSMQESFRRLFPIRLCTMHARPLTNDDLLLLHVEVRRLLKAIRGR